MRSSRIRWIVSFSSNELFTRALRNRDQRTITTRFPFDCNRMAVTVEHISEFLESFAPLEIAEDWDNVGLLLGEPEAEVRRGMTCLTLTPDVAAEAVERQVELIVSHHPILFRPVQSITSATQEGQLLLNLIRNGVAVYSPHTAFDSARLGINQQLAESFELHDIVPLRLDEQAELGSGRAGQLQESVTLRVFLDRVRRALDVPHMQFVGDLEARVSKVAVACGSAGGFLTDARRAGCDVFVTGEARFHTLLEARMCGTSMILPGHYATERPAVERLATILQQQYPELEFRASQQETDPLRWSQALEDD